MKIYPVTLNNYRCKNNTDNSLYSFGANRYKRPLITPRSQRLHSFQERYNLEFHDEFLLDAALAFGRIDNMYSCEQELHKDLVRYGKEALSICVSEIVRDNFLEQDVLMRVLAKHKALDDEFLQTCAKKIKVAKLANINNSNDERLKDVFLALMGAIYMDNPNGVYGVYKFLKENLKDEIVSITPKPTRTSKPTEVHIEGSPNPTKVNVYYKINCNPIKNPNGDPVIKIL